MAAVLPCERVFLPPLHQNPPHCLEITPPSSEKLVSVMRLSDLSTEDDDSGHCKMNRYDKKIDSLMNAVGCLKSEVREVGAGLSSVPRPLETVRWGHGGHPLPAASAGLPGFQRPLWGQSGQPGIPLHQAFSPGLALTLPGALYGGPGLIFFFFLQQ